LNNKILALDLDGVIFNFNSSYISWLNTNFKAGIPPDGDNYPDTWNYATDGNYVTKEQEKEFWKYASGIGNYSFWRFLTTYPNAKEFLEKCQTHFSEVHYVTSRPGDDVKRATEDALSVLGVKSPSVFIASNKPPVLKQIGATHFLDDRDKNFEDCLTFNYQTAQLDDLNMFILDRPWNRHYNHPHVERIFNPNEIFNGDIKV
jgi:hypothetical protein